MRWRFVWGSVAVLFVSSYLDNVRGPLLPFLSRQLAVSYSKMSWLLIAGNFAAAIGNLLLIPLSERGGIRVVTLVTTFLGILVWVAATQVEGFPSLMVFAVLCGVAVAGLGSVCNLLMLRGTDPVHRARAFCGLHVMYGVGSVGAPGFVGFLLARQVAWPMVVAPGAVVLAVLLVWAWFRLEAEPVKEVRPWFQRLSANQIWIVITFCVYVACEVLMSMWMTTYLVEVPGLTVEGAAPYLSGFFLMMAITRLICLFSLPPKWETPVLAGSFLAAVIFFLMGHAGQLWAFTAAGILGPFFPVLLARVSRQYPEEAPTLTLWILTSIQLTLAVFHLVVGRLADVVGVSRSYLLPVPLAVLTFVFLGICLAREKRCIVRP